MSDAIKDGGAAFPVSHMQHFHQEHAQAGEFGMSLRDYFAWQAMNGLAGSDKILEAMAKSTDSFSIVSRANAIMAYELADAMLAERAKAGAA